MKRKVWEVKYFAGHPLEIAGNSHNESRPVLGRLSFNSVKLPNIAFLRGL